MDCKLRAKNCGGCPMLGMDYAAQLKQKEETVKKLLGKYGPVEHIRGMETPYHYRNKVVSTFTTGWGGKHLIAVVVRLLHAPDGVHRAVFAHQSTHFFFLLFQLFGIVQPQQGAAAAIFGTQFAIHGSFFLYITDTLFSGYHRAGWIATASRCVFCSFLFYRRGFTFPR